MNSGDVFAIGPAMFRFQAATADLPASGTFPLSEQQSTNFDAGIAAHIARLERRLEAAEAGHLEAVLPLMSALTNQTLTNRVVAETSTDVATGGSEDVSQPSNSDGDCEQAGVDAKRLHNLELKLHRQSQSLEDCSRRIEEQESQLQHEQTEFEQSVAEFEQRVADVSESAAAAQKNEVQRSQEELAARQQQLERLCEREASGAADHLSKEQDIAAHEQRLTERESLLAERDSALAEQQRQIEALEEQRSERDKERAEEFQISQEESRAQAADSVNAAEAALGTRAEELDAREVELGVRYDETAARVVQLKRLAKANSIPPPSATDSASADEELIAELEDAHRRSTVLESERDELNTALVELREAFQSLHDEWVMRQKADAEIEALGNSEQQHTQQ